MSSKGPQSDKKLSENFLNTALQDFEKNIAKINDLSARGPNYSKEIQIVQNKNDNILKHLRDLVDHPDNHIKQHANDVLIKAMSKQFQTKAFAMPLPTIPAASPSQPTAMPALPSLPAAQPAVTKQPEMEPAKQALIAKQNQKSEKKSFFKQIAAQFTKSLSDYDNSPENTTKRMNIILKKNSKSASLKSKKAELDKLYGIQPGDKTDSVISKIFDHFSRPRDQVLQQVDKQLNAKMVELAKNVVEGKMTLKDANLELNKAAELIINNAKEKIKEAIKEDRGSKLAGLEYAIISGVLNGKVNKKSAMAKIKAAQAEHADYTAESEKGNFNVFRSSAGMGMLADKLAAEVKKQSPAQPLSATLPPLIDVPVSGKSQGQGFFLDLPNEDPKSNNNQVSAAALKQNDNPRTLLFRPPPPSTPPPAKEAKADVETKTTPKYK